MWSLVCLYAALPHKLHVMNVKIINLPGLIPAWGPIDVQTGLHLCLFSCSWYLVLYNTIL